MKYFLLFLFLLVFLAACSSVNTSSPESLSPSLDENQYDLEKELDAFEDLDKNLDDEELARLDEDLNFENL